MRHLLGAGIRERCIEVWVTIVTGGAFWGMKGLKPFDAPTLMGFTPGCIASRRPCEIRYFNGYALWTYFTTPFLWRWTA